LPVQHELILCNHHRFQTLFIGYDLLGYIDGSKPCPPATLTQDNTTRPNPEYILWIRQDQLILNAVIGSILPTIIPFIAQATTSRQAWTILANTYAKPSRGRIKQIKNQLKNTTKGSLSVTEFMQTVKTRADDLALLGASLDEVFHSSANSKCSSNIHPNTASIHKHIPEHPNNLTFLDILNQSTRNYYPSHSLNDHPP
jgi:hypothetical protein